MIKYNYKELSELTGISFDGVVYRAKQLGLKPFREGNTYYYNFLQAEAIQKYKKTTKKNGKYQRRNITIIEHYFRGFNSVRISRITGISKFFCDLAVKEWKTNGTVTVESRMNGDEPQI